MTNYDKQRRREEKLIKERQDALARAESAENERIRLYSILDGIMHETRRLNSEIASACEEVSKNIEKKDYALASSNADDAFYTSGLISSRLTFADYEINPEAITRQAKYSANVYKKFDKARRILARNAKRRKIRVILNGPSRNEINVLPAFEMVPFVLIENAVKYSPGNQDVVIDVRDSPSPGVRINVRITSTGPTIDPEELPRLTQRGSRGKSAIKSGIVGEGIGLYLANTLVKLANGRMLISASQDMKYMVDGVSYSEFEVNLFFS
ncbi:signal transduction histidine kinase [Xanthomonas sp. F14]